MTPVALVGRHPWFELRFDNGAQFTSTLKAAVEAECTTYGVSPRWDKPRTCSDGRTAWPLEPLTITEGITA